MRRRRTLTAPPAGLTVARTIMGSPVVWPFGVGSLLFAGQTGSGKSTAVRALLWEAAARADVALVLVDLKRAELSPWRPRALTLATSRPDAVKALDAVRDEVDRRTETITDVGRTDWDTALGPWLLVVVDELAELLHAPEAEKDVAKEATRLLDSIGRLGRAVGVHLVAATQHPDATTLPTSLRGQFTHGAALRVRDHSTAQIITQGAPCDLTTLGDLGPGWAYWLDAGSSSWPDLVLPTFHPIADVAEHVARYAHLRAVAA